MKEIKLAKNVFLRGDRIRVYFNFPKGSKIRRKEYIPQLILHPDNNGEVPKKVLQYAKDFLGTVNHLIETNSFNYLAHFPSSPAAKNAPGHVDKNMLVNELISDWFAKATGSLAPMTVAGYKSKSNYINSRFGEMRVIDVHDIDIEDWLGDPEDGIGYLSNKTIVEVLNVFRQIFDRAIKKKIIVDNPVPSSKGIKVKKPEIRPFTKKEIAAIINRPTDFHQEMNMVQFMMFTGLCMAEVMGLAWEDLDMLDWRAHIHINRAGGKWKHVKNDGRMRDIDLDKPAQTILRRQMDFSFYEPPMKLDVLDEENKKYVKKKRRPIFRTTKTNTPHWDGKYVRQWWADHIAAAHVQHRGPNNMRHTFASQMLTLGANVNWVRNQLGHKTEQMTRMRYGKWIPEDAPRFGALISEQLGQELISKTSGKIVSTDNAPIQPQHAAFFL